MPNPRDVKSIGGLLHPGAGLGLRPPRAARSGSTSTGSATSTGSRSTAARPTTSSSARALRSCSCTGSARRGSRGWRTSRSSRATTASWRWTCPASATRSCPTTRSRSSTTRAGPSGCWTRSGSTPAAVVGNSMGGFSAAEMAIRSPERVQSLTVVSAAVFWQSYRRAQPLVGLARLSDAYVARALDALDRRGRDAAAPALVGARHGGLPLPAPDRAGARPRAGAQRQADGRLPARAGGAGRLPARGGAAEDLLPRR